MSIEDHPSSARLVLMIAAVTVGTFSTAFALDRDPAGAARPDVRPPAEVVGAADCAPMCASHVIASPVPGRPAMVVDGATAFGLAIEGGPAVGDTTQRVVDTAPAVRVRIEGLVSPGPEAGVRTVVPVRIEPRPSSGGLAVADAGARIDHRLSGL